MADVDSTPAHAEHDVEHDVEHEDVLPTAELEDHGDEDDGEAGSSARACEGLAALAGDTPSGGQPVIAKLLISNAAAGSVIGKVRCDAYC